jgi:hypothetical protein
MYFIKWFQLDEWLLGGLLLLLYASYWSEQSFKKSNSDSCSEFVQRSEGMESNAVSLHDLVIEALKR